jgi:molybdenum-dependent DNA-binding transcriptional regulator ModE
MKRSFNAIASHEDDAELFSNTHADHAYNEEAGSPTHSDNDNGNASDSDCGSDQKSRKKRNAYQKISDDIRVSLLEAVQNGETLKAAAKRYKINYSSAKSILHTYRKEGRILKKSAQERTTKKKFGGASENKPSATKPTKSFKKENTQADENAYKQSKSFEPLTKKVKTETVSSNFVDEVVPLGKVDNNRNKDVPSYEDHHEGHGNTKTLPIIPIIAPHEHEGHADMHFMNSRNASRKNSMHQFKLFDNFHAMNFSDIAFPDFNHMPGDSHDFMNYRRLSRDFDSFNDMVSALHGKNGQHEEHQHDPSAFLGQKSHVHGDDKHGKVENMMDFEDHGEPTGNCPLRSFMDTQRMFRNALRKASFLSYGSNTGYRKGSFDLMF